MDNIRLNMYLVTLADQLLELLPGLTDLILHHLASHAAVRNASVPDVLRPLAGSKVLVRKGGELLLVLPGQIGHISHGHGQESPGSDGTESEGRQGAEENATVA